MTCGVLQAPRLSVSVSGSHLYPSLFPFSTFLSRFPFRLPSQPFLCTLYSAVIGTKYSYCPVSTLASLCRSFSFRHSSPTVCLFPFLSLLSLFPFFSLCPHSLVFTSLHLYTICARHTHHDDCTLYRVAFTLLQYKPTTTITIDTPYHTDQAEKQKTKNEK